MTDSQSRQIVVMPRLGLTMTEATIIEWHKANGEFVEKGENLFTFESDKVTLELEAPTSGRLTILVPVGQTVAVQTPVAEIGGSDADSPAPPAQPQAAAGDRARAITPTVATPLPGNGDVRASPKARALARERGLSLRGVRGSGPRGMIVSADVAASAAPGHAVKVSPLARRVADQKGIDLAQVRGSGPQGRVMRADLEHATQSVSTGSPTPSGLTGLRGIIAERLAQGWRERPQVTLTSEADATQLVAVRQQAGAELGEKIAYDALLVLVVARALSEFRYMNVQLTETGIEQQPQINIGVAVDTERGLLVPVIHDADRATLSEINQSLRAMAERAQSGRSQPDDLTGGTFSITNLGMYGIDAFTPIINPPECAILGVGRIVARPVGIDGQIVLRDMMALSLSFDHRLVDGAPAARFLARVRQLIEQPLALFIR